MFESGGSDNGMGAGGFWGEMFKGIAQTFQAGKDVNVAQIGERQQKRELAFGREQLYYDRQNTKLNAIFSFNQQQQKLLIIVVVAMIAFVGLMLIFRKR